MTATKRRMKGAVCQHEEEAHGWLFGWIDAYPDTVTIECPACGHLSVRDRDQVPTHVCQGCGRQGTSAPPEKNKS